MIICKVTTASSVVSALPARTPNGPIYNPLNPRLVQSHSIYKVWILLIY